jgi:hypothetical protein
MLVSDDENIEAQLAELRSHLEGLESGQLHIGNPHEGRTEAQMYDLRRKPNSKQFGTKRNEETDLTCLDWSRDAPKRAPLSP